MMVGPFDLDVALPDGTGDVEYLAALESIGVIRKQ